MKYPEQYRLDYSFKDKDVPGLENAAAFKIPYKGCDLRVIASLDEGWEHVSVSLPNRNPNWDEMCHVKDLFWGDDEECIQFHPRKNEYVNLTEYCLHIWKPPFYINKPPKQDNSEVYGA